MYQHINSHLWVMRLWVVYFLQFSGFSKFSGFFFLKYIMTIRGKCVCCRKFGKQEKWKEENVYMCYWIANIQKWRWSKRLKKENLAPRMWCLGGWWGAEENHRYPHMWLSLSVRIFLPSSVQGLANHHLWLLELSPNSQPATKPPARSSSSPLQTHCFPIPRPFHTHPTPNPPHCPDRMDRDTLGHDLPCFPHLACPPLTPLPWPLTHPSRLLPGSASPLGTGGSLMLNSWYLWPAQWLQSPAHPSRAPPHIWVLYGYSVPECLTHKQVHILGWKVWLERG